MLNTGGQSVQTAQSPPPLTVETGNYKQAKSATDSRASTLLTKTSGTPLERVTPSFLQKMVEIHGRSSKGGQLGAVGDDDANMYSAIQFLDEETGWIAGVRVSPTTKSQFALIQKTTDGGQNWVTQATGKEDILEDIFFLDASMGWAVGENGVILHTNDGGETWKEQASGTQETLRSVGFADEKNGWAVGGDFGVGAILHTSDGGKTWELKDSKEKIVKVFVLDGQNVWVASSTGAIMQAQ